MSISEPQDDPKPVIQLLKPRVEEFLCDLIAIPSLSGHEEAAIDYCAEAFSGLADEVTKVALNDTMREDPDASEGLEPASYEGRHNLSLRLRGSGEGRVLLLNAHLDVVPPSEGQLDAFSPRIVGDMIYGRGACDDKGSVASIYMLFRTVRQLGITLPIDLVVHLVVEEETSGNGTLAMVREGAEADGAIVMEPSNLNIVTAARGVIWFRIECRGKSAHSGCSGNGRSALKLAIKVMDILERYHTELLAESHETPPYERHENPMPLCFGLLSSGNWPAMLPDRARLEGILGFLPNRTRQQVKQELMAALANHLSRDEVENVKVAFTVAREWSMIEHHHPLVEKLASAASSAGVSPNLFALTGSTDAWLYDCRAGVPTVVFGPGRLECAHSSDECVSVSDIAVAAHTLLLFAKDF